PNPCLLYFAVEDVDATHRAAVDAGATEMLAPADFNGGRFAIPGDPQGAAFGLLRLADQQGRELHRERRRARAPPRARARARASPRRARRVPRGGPALP